MNFKKLEIKTEKPYSQNLNTSHRKIYLQNTYLIKDYTPTIPKNLEQTTSLKCINLNTWPKKIYR